MWQGKAGDLIRNAQYYIDTYSFSRPVFDRWFQNVSQLESLKKRYVDILECPLSELEDTQHTLDKLEGNLRGRLDLPVA